MEDFVIASNRDNRIEAFYIKDGQVHHTWQEDPSDPTKWLPSVTLDGSTKLPGKPTRVEACSDQTGRIHVVVFTEDYKYFTIYQSKETETRWEGWFPVMQE